MPSFRFGSRKKTVDADDTTVTATDVQDENVERSKRMSGVVDLFRKSAVNFWRGILSLRRKETIVVLVVTACVGAAFSFVSLIPTQAATQELTTASASSSWKDIYTHPVNAPYKIATHVSTQFTKSVRSIRIISLVFYLAACIAMFYALKHWHTVETSALTTIAFATNAVTLGVARLGTPYTVQFSFFIFTSVLLWYVHTKSRRFVPIIIALTVGTLIYTPAILWFFGVLGFVYIDKIKKFLRKTSRKSQLIGLIVCLLIVSPLIASFFKDINNLKEWLLLPNTIQWGEVPQAILRVPSAFVYRMPLEPLINIDRLPIFDITSGILFIIGFYAYIRKITLERTRVMIGSGIVACVLGAFGQATMAIVMLLPFAYSVIAAGIEYLLDEWYRVFPRNPIARSFGVIAVSSVLLFGVYFQLTKFLVVWPQTPETRATYNQSRIIHNQ